MSKDKSSGSLERRLEKIDKRINELLNEKAELEKMKK